MKAILFFTSLVAAVAWSQETPIGPKWCPAEWGPEDQRGAANRLTPGKVLEAKNAIQTGRIYQLGRLYEFGMPIPGKRHFSLTIPGLPTGVAEGENHVVHNDELVSGEIGQIGTQFDGLGHLGVRVGSDDLFYNGFRLADFGDTYGLKKLGVENVGAIFTRGILLDVAAVQRKERLPTGYVITPQDLEQALEVTRVNIRPGDAILIHTGHGQLWMNDNKTFGEGEPGIGLEAGRWLSEKKIVLVGSDNWALEAVPSQDPKRPFEVHQWLIVRQGI